AALAELHAREREIADRVALCDEQVQVAAAMLRAADDEVRRGEAQLAELDLLQQTAASVAAARADRQARVLAAAGDVEALGRMVDEAIESAEAAREAYVEAGVAVGEAMAHLRHVTEAIEAARARTEADGEVTPEQAQAAALAVAEDIEWFLLARLAAQRSASYAGSVPLVLDDALAGMDPALARSILDRLERMASSVQLVI